MSRNPFPARCWFCFTRAQTLEAPLPADAPTYADEAALEAHVAESHPPAQMVMLLSWAMAQVEQVPA